MCTTGQSSMAILSYTNLNKYPSIGVVKIQGSLYFPCVPNSPFYPLYFPCVPNSPFYPLYFPCVPNSPFYPLYFPCVPNSPFYPLYLSCAMVSCSARPHTLYNSYRTLHSSDMDTQAQNFWIESINKETALRFQWRLRYSKQFSAATFQSRKKDKGMKLGNELSQRLSLLEKNQKDSIPKQLSPVQPEKLVEVDLTLPDMRPPSANTRALLYTGISAHGEGRRAYLARRKNLRPDEKYDFPMMTSSNYGWKVLEYSDLKKSPHARTGIIRDSFYRPSGVMITAGVHD